MAKDNYHVVPKGNKWAVKREGAKRADSLHDTQKEAADRAKELAKKNHGESVIHRPDGRIRDKDSYGPDPYPPKDKKH
ncbi:MAG: DUF2188 domain-containing protein [Deltaproteobacteria bacterium]|nr:DUF2188 domain-containing protein [Deltaproteobacteria bacterium]